MISDLEIKLFMVLGGVGILTFLVIMVWGELRLKKQWKQLMREVRELKECVEDEKRR